MCGERRWSRSPDNGPGAKTLAVANLFSAGAVYHRGAAHPLKMHACFQELICGLRRPALYSPAGEELKRVSGPPHRDMVLLESPSSDRCGRCPGCDEFYRAGGCGENGVKLLVWTFRFTCYLFCVRTSTCPIIEPLALFAEVIGGAKRGDFVWLWWPGATKQQTPLSLSFSPTLLQWFICPLQCHLMKPKKRN